MSNMRMAKYETMIEDIDSTICGWEGSWEGSSTGSTTLALIYDYEKCNEYAKVIMDKSTLEFTEYRNGSNDVWEDIYPTYDEFEDPKRRIEASKKLVQLGRMTENFAERYKFIFWALMILTVEKTDAEEHLALICDFAKMLRITEDEFEDIIQSIKIVYNEVTAEYEFKSDDVQRIFEPLFNMYDGQAIE